jgi:hypothetical protein
MLAMSTPALLLSSVMWTGYLAVQEFKSAITMGHVRAQLDALPADATWDEVRAVFARVKVESVEAWPAAPPERPLRYFQAIIPSEATWWGHRIVITVYFDERDRMKEYRVSGLIAGP